MKGNRPSALPISIFCGRAAALNEGAGRAAAISSCYHAKCAGISTWRDMYNRLTDEEQAELDEMAPPTRTEVNDVWLDYIDAETEVTVGLNEVCGFDVGPSALTVGTCDMFWLIDGIVYLADIKRSQWTTADGPDSLQVKCYALAVCAMLQEKGLTVHGYYTGIYAATEQAWMWSGYTSLDSDECLRDWERVKAAAMNKSDEYSTGPHCRSCYSRLKCPAWLVPPEHAKDGIAKYLAGELNAERALELLQMVQRVEDTVKSAKSVLKAFAELNGGIDDGKGKVYKAVMCKGRMSLDKASLEAEHPELVQKYMVQGKPYPQMKWVNK